MGRHTHNIQANVLKGPPVGVSSCHRLEKQQSDEFRTNGAPPPRFKAQMSSSGPDKQSREKVVSHAQAAVRDESGKSGSQCCKPKQPSTDPPTPSPQAMKCLLPPALCNFAPLHAFESRPKRDTTGHIQHKRLTDTPLPLVRNGDRNILPGSCLYCSTPKQCRTAP